MRLVHTYLAGPQWIQPTGRETLTVTEIKSAHIIRTGGRSMGTLGGDEVKQKIGSLVYLWPIFVLSLWDNSV